MCFDNNGRYRNEETGSNGIDMKNVLRVLGLAVRCYDTVVVEAEGEDEELAVEQLTVNRSYF